MRDHRKLKAFQSADALVLSIYQLTSEFPESERYGLTSQIRRAAVSVASNIVEGSLRSSEREYLRFLEIAYGSAGEVAYQLTLAERLSFANVERIVPVAELASETVGRLGGLVRYLERG